MSEVFGNACICCDYARSFSSRYGPRDALRWTIIKAEESILLSRAEHFTRPYRLDERQAYSLCSYDWNIIRFVSAKHLFEHFKRLKGSKKVFWKTCFVKFCLLTSFTDCEIDIDAFHLTFIIYRYRIQAPLVISTDVPAVDALAFVPSEVSPDCEAPSPDPPRKSGRGWLRRLRRVLRCILTCGCASKMREDSGVGLPSPPLKKGTVVG